MTTTLLISGYFPSHSFPEWIAHRAEVLSLTGWVKYHNQHLIEVQVSGHQVLVDAMEAASRLGPMDVMVDSIEVQPTALADDRAEFTIL